MKFKLPNPEDYTDIENYAFKLAKAYSVLYGDAITLLVNVRISLDALKSGEDYDREWAIKNLQKILDEYKI